MKTAIKNIHIKNKKTVAVTLPLTAFKYLYSADMGKKLVIEIDADFLKKINEPRDIDEMVADARLEYFDGKLKGFVDTKKLMNYLNA